MRGSDGGGNITGALARISNLRRGSRLVSRSTSATDRFLAFRSSHFLRCFLQTPRFELTRLLRRKEGGEARFGVVATERLGEAGRVRVEPALGVGAAAQQPLEAEARHQQRGEAEPVGADA